MSCVCQTYLCEGFINYFPWNSLTIKSCCTYSKDINGKNQKYTSEITEKQQFKVECLKASKMRRTCVMRTNGALNQYKIFLNTTPNLTKHFDEIQTFLNGIIR